MAKEQIFGLAQTRQQLGVGDEQDVVLARTTVSGYQEGLKQGQLAHEQTLRGLELLLGRYPGAELKTRRDLTKLPDPIPAGVPLAVLERRPDLIAAERRVAAAFNRVGEAKAARLPALRLTANLGAISSSILQLRDDFENPISGVGAALLAPIYQGGPCRPRSGARGAPLHQQPALLAGLLRHQPDDPRGVGGAGLPVPEQHYVMRGMVAGAGA